MKPMLSALLLGFVSLISDKFIGVCSIIASHLKTVTQFSFMC